MKTNKDIRQAASAAGIRLWQIAEALGYNESAFSRKLRKELPDSEKEMALRAIEVLVEKGESIYE